MLTDHERCRVMLVTLPEETPVNELVDTAFSLEDRVGVGLGPVVVNGLYDELPGLGDAPGRRRGVGGAPRSATARPTGSPRRPRFRRDRTALQVEQVGRLAEQLPLAQIRLPFVFTAEIGPAELDQLAGRLLAEIDALPEVV